MKKIIFIFAALIICFIALSAAKDRIIKYAVKIAATRLVGAPVAIDGFRLDMRRGALRIEGLRVYQPKGFPEGILLDIPLINAECDMGELFKGRIALPLIELDLRELVVVVDREGKMSVDALAAVETEEKPARKAEPLPMKIDQLKLSIGRVVIKQYSGSQRPSIKIYNIGIKNKVFNNIPDAREFTKIILVEAMKAAGIKGAKVYGLISLAGAGFLPAAGLMAVTGKDSASESFKVSFEKAYEAAVGVLKESGSLSGQDKGQGEIRGRFKGAAVTIRIGNKPADEVTVTISARQLLFPKPQIAGELLYELSNKLLKE